MLERMYLCWRESQRSHSKKTRGSGLACKAGSHVRRVPGIEIDNGCYHKACSCDDPFTRKPCHPVCRASREECDTYIFYLAPVGKSLNAQDCSPEIFSIVDSTCRNRVEMLDVILDFTQRGNDPKSFEPGIEIMKKTAKSVVLESIVVSKDLLLFGVTSASYMVGFKGEAVEGTPTTILQAADVTGNEKTGLPARTRCLLTSFSIWSRL